MKPTSMSEQLGHRTSDPKEAYKVAPAVASWAEDCFALAANPHLTEASANAACRRLNARFLERQAVPLLETEDASRALATVDNLRAQALGVIRLSELMVEGGES